MPVLTVDHIKLHYYSSNGVMANGHPNFPRLEPGKTYVFPLALGENRWRLFRAEGHGIIAPAIAAKPAGTPPASKREFVIRELLNVLLGGSHADRYRFGNFMQFRMAGKLNEEIITALTAGLRPGDPRWLDISTALLANIGIPRLKLEEFVAGKPQRVTFALDLLAKQTLLQVPESQRRDGIIRTMLRFSAIHYWGTAATLVPEFTDDPLLLELLPGYLERSQKGAVYTACWLVNDGQMALLDLTLEAALKDLTSKSVDYGELNAVCKLLLDHGSDLQFEEYLKILNETKEHDIGRYDQLWQVAWEKKSQRVLRILAVLLDDEREASPEDSVRYCDFAASLLNRFTTEKFEFKPWDQMSLDERNTAVARARAWMKEARPDAK